MLSLSLPGRSLSSCLSFPPPLFPLAHRALAKSWPLHWGNFFPGSPKAILPRFPLDLYPLPMFQIIYSRIYLLYVLADSFGNSAKEPPYSFIDCICYIWFIFVCHSLSTLGFPSQSRRGGGASWRCYRKKKKNKYDATLLSFKSDKYTVADHQKRGREQYGVADKLLWPLSPFGLQSA